MNAILISIFGAQNYPLEQYVRFYTLVIRVVNVLINVTNVFFFLSLENIQRLIHFFELQFLKKCGSGTI